jgi:hypothetical protein
MGVSEILATIDREIAQLQQARALLSGVAAPVAKRRPGRPRKIDTAVTPAAKPARKRKRKLTPEGRKRIAEAVKKRWAAQKAKKAAPKKAAAAKPAKKKRSLSPEGRKRIAEAAKKRWAAQKAVVAS